MLQNRKSRRAAKGTHAAGALAALMAAGLVVAGCGESGGGGGGITYVAAESGSFFPGKGLSKDSGDPTDVYWTYKVNGGVPIVLTDDPAPGDTMTLNFGNLNVSVNVAALKRTVAQSQSFSGTMTGMDFTGSVSISSTENVSLPDGGGTIIEDEHVVFDQTMTLFGITMKIVGDMTTLYDTPYDWHPDRDDLDGMVVGEVLGSSAATGTMTGTMKTYLNGTLTDDIPVNGAVSSAETWTITAKLPSMTVQGVDYTNIVVVDRELSAVDPSTGALQDVTYTYWLAKGIGPVKMLGLVEGPGGPVDIELIATNLEQPAP